MNFFPGKKVYICGTFSLQEIFLNQKKSQNSGNYQTISPSRRTHETLRILERRFRFLKREA